MSILRSTMSCKRMSGTVRNALYCAVVALCIAIYGCGTLPSKITPRVDLRHTAITKMPLSVQVNYDRLRDHRHKPTPSVTINTGQASQHIFSNGLRVLFEEVTDVERETPSPDFFLVIPEIVDVDTKRVNSNLFSDPTFCKVVYRLTILDSRGTKILDKTFSGEISRIEKINRAFDVLTLGINANRLRAEAYSKLFNDAAQVAFGKMQGALRSSIALASGTPSTPASLAPSPKVEKQHFATDKIPPKIVIAEPPLSRGLTVVAKKKGISIEGKALDESGISEVLVNGSEAILSASGAFSFDVLLAIGKNMIQVQATDTKGNTAQERFTVVRRQELKRQETTGMTSSRVGRYYSLLIGCQDYYDPALQDLDYPTRDSMHLQAVLTELYEFDLQDVTILRNPDRKEIIKEFEKLTKKVTPRDNLLIFFAGHGYWDEKFKQGYWLPRNSTRTDRSEWISNATIRGFVRGIRSRHTLIIADACFSGGIFKSRKAFRGSPEAIEQLYKLPSRKAMTSGTVNEVPDKSVFIEYLLKRLRQNTARYLTAEVLFSSFREAVINNSPIGQVPQFGEIREAGDEGGDFIFIRKE